MEAYEAYPTDIEALLQDINGNYGEATHERPPRPPLPSASRISNPFSIHAERSRGRSNALASIHEQQPLYEAQILRPSDTYSYSTDNNNGLDAYGSC